MKLCEFILSTAAAGVIGLCAGQAQAADLIDTYQLALQQDPVIEAARAAFQSIQEAQPQARSALLPQIELSASRIETESEVDSPGAGGIAIFQSRSLSLATDGYTLNLIQAIYHRDFFVALDQADVSIAQAAAELRAAEQALILRVAGAYFNVLAAQDNLEFARSEKEAIARLLEQAQRRFEVGMVAITDVREAQAQYDLALAQEIGARNRLNNRREQLQEIISQTPERLRPMAERIALVKPDPADVSAWVDTALEQNLELIAARYATQVFDLEIDRRHAQHYPTLDFIASYSETDDPYGDLEDRSTTDQAIGIQLNLPIYSGGFVSSRTDEARFDYQRALAVQERERRETISETRASYLDVLADISRVRALEQALISTQAAFEATEAGFEVGTRTSVDVLLALRDTFISQRNYAAARYQYLLDTLRLKRAAGILSVEDLRGVNAWLAPPQIEK